MGDLTREFSDCVFRVCFVGFFVFESLLLLLGEYELELPGVPGVDAESGNALARSSKVSVEGVVLMMLLLSGVEMSQGLMN
jgi:hypothetical protein